MVQPPAPPHSIPAAKCVFACWSQKPRRDDDDHKKSKKDYSDDEDDDRKSKKKSKKEYSDDEDDDRKSKKKKKKSKKRARGSDAWAEPIALPGLCPIVGASGWAGRLTASERKLPTDEAAGPDAGTSCA